MVACGATMTVQGAGGSSREIGADDFFVDIFETALAEGEILTAIRVPNYAKGTGGCYLKHRHPASSYAVVGAAAIVTVDGGKCSKVSVVIGGVTTKATRASAVEKALTGQAADAVAAAAEKVADSISDPIGDHYASGEFRTHLAGVLVKRALLEAVVRATG
jgi:carbon-monoxide dehydrogenase medium subunit